MDPFQNGRNVKVAVALYYGFYVAHAGFHQKVGVCACMYARWHTASAQSSEALNDSARWVSGLIVRCPPALLPRPFLCTLLLMLMPVARNAGGALCAVRGYCAERAGGTVRPASLIRCKHALRSSWSTTHRPCPCHQERHHKHTRHHKSHSWGAGRGAARLLRGGDTVPESEPFAPRRPPAESPRTEPSSHQYCML